MKLPFLSKNPPETATTAAPSWPWPTCASNPKTLSFRANEDIYKTVNSAYLEEEQDTKKNLDFITNTSPDESAVIRGLRSDRLFFEPGETSSILEEAKTNYEFPYKDSVAILAMDSIDPFVDFRLSMEEMVEAHKLKNWECLEELLTCYLKVNGKSNHGYIIGAFVDLLMNLSTNIASVDSSIDEPNCFSSSSSSVLDTHYSFTSPLSFSSSSCSSTISPCLSSMENEDHEITVIGKSISCEEASSSGV